MNQALSRSRMLLGDTAIQRLSKARVAIFGVGGVGGYAVEALARNGVGVLDLIDADFFSESNLNRQILATKQSIGKPKVEVAAQRVADISDAKVHTYPIFVDETTIDRFCFSDYDYVIDAIDTVKSKVLIVLRATNAGTPVISAMGAGNKLNPAGFRVMDLFDTAVDPLAKTMRNRLKREGIRKLKVVCSSECPMKPDWSGLDEERCPGSVSFVPGVAGLILAGEVICDLTGVRGLGSGI